MKHNFNSRRDFLQFLGATGLATLTTPLIPSVLAGCSTRASKSASRPVTNAWQARFIQPIAVDDLVVASGIEKRILIKWGEPIGANGLAFGTNNDYCAFIPKDPSNPTDGVLMVNHEYLTPIFVSKYVYGSKIAKTREQVAIEQASVGISLLRFHKKGDDWVIDRESPLNRRLDGNSVIPFDSAEPIEGARMAKGTFANCAGGLTPWRTFLTCEENYELFYGEWDYSPDKGSIERRKVPRRELHSLDYGWSRFEERPPTHYGWVVEIDPWSGSAIKRIALGRMAHECATCVRSSSGQTVAYMGDDSANECLYKFVSNEKDSLKSGTLYVARLEEGRWIPITMSSRPDFKKRFLNETDLKARTREAAKLLGGTPLDRPEDIEINPLNKDVIVALTNNPVLKKPHGSLLRLREKNSDPGATEFESSTWIAGGPETGLSSPDNLAFDKSGNLWCTNDISGNYMNKGPYAQFKNNGLFFIPMHGEHAGRVFQVASAPNDAELTGPMFTPDGETLLLSVQHPGEMTSDLAKPTSTWPDGPGHPPKSALVALTGPFLRELVNLKS